MSKDPAGRRRRVAPCMRKQEGEGGRDSKGFWAGVDVGEDPTDRSPQAEEAGRPYGTGGAGIQ